MTAKKPKKNKTTSDPAQAIQSKFGIVGRAVEIKKLWSILNAGRNVLIEGPVGVGKTVLAAAVAEQLGIDVIRIDGDSRFTEQKLTGWFDPAQVLKKGYTTKTFHEGPLVQAMKKGCVLFINELNRMPEAVQNVLLPAIDEGFLTIPQLGEIKAKPGFLVIATQNPKEFVATSHLSEALMDRLEWVQLGYQSFEEECEIAESSVKLRDPSFIKMAVTLIRMTRSHPKIKRGASIRAALAILKILEAQEKSNHNISKADFWLAASLALPTRIELLSQEFDGSYEQQVEIILSEFQERLEEELKKNSWVTQTSLSH